MMLEMARATQVACRIDFTFRRLPAKCGANAPMTLRRSVVAFYALLFVALTLFAGLFFLRTYGEVASLEAQERESRQRLAELRSHLAHQTDKLERLRTDPVYVERAIREKLGYARPEETVYRFER